MKLKIHKMIDLKDKIRKIIIEEKQSKHFTILDESSTELIEQIISNYERLNNLHQDFNNLPKKAELIFVAAPTGAGKDSLVTRLTTARPEKNYIELNMDMFRQYFQRFIPEVELRDKTFAEQTGEFSYEMYYIIQEILLSEFPGTNIIITGTLRETDWVEDTFKKYKSNKNTDYEITLASLAVPEKDSGFSILKRYVSIVDNGIIKRDENGVIEYSEDFLPGSARYTSLDYHNETYERFPENLKKFLEIFENGIIDDETKEKKTLIDKMEVYRRARKDDNSLEDTLMYSSENESQSDITALDMVNLLRESESQITQDDIFSLFEILTDRKNQAYFKNQKVIEEIIKDLAEILEKKEILEKHMQKRKKSEDPNFGENNGGLR